MTLSLCMTAINRSWAGVCQFVSYKSMKSFLLLPLLRNTYNFRLCYALWFISLAWGSFHGVGCTSKLTPPQPLATFKWSLSAELIRHHTSRIFVYIFIYLIIILYSSIMLFLYPAVFIMFSIHFMFHKDV